MDRSARAGRVYLPLSYDLTGRAVLIVGGGRAAAQKVRALSPFQVSVLVVSPDFDSGLEAAAGVPGATLTLLRQPWDEGVWSSSSVPIGLVLACTDRPEVQAAVVASARTRGVPVLDAAEPTAGDFVQPASARFGDYTLTVSSNGTEPRGSVEVRDTLRPAFEAAVRDRKGPSGR